MDPIGAFEVYKALQQKGTALEFASAFWDDKMLVPRHRMDLGHGSGTCSLGTLRCHQTWLARKSPELTGGLSLGPSPISMVHFPAMFDDTPSGYVWKWGATKFDVEIIQCPLTRASLGGILPTQMSQRCISKAQICVVNGLWSMDDYPVVRRERFGAFGVLIYRYTLGSCSELLGVS